MTSKQINKLLNDGRHTAIIREIAGQRYLFGFSRPPTSRKKHHIIMLRAPLNLTTLVAQHNKEKSPCQDHATGPTSSNTTENPAN